MKVIGLGGERAVDRKTDGKGDDTDAKPVRKPVREDVAPKITRLLGGEIGAALAEGLQHVEEGAEERAAALEEKLDTSIHDIKTETDERLSNIGLDVGEALSDAQAASEAAKAARGEADAAKQAATSASEFAAASRNEAGAAKALLQGLKFTTPEGEELTGQRAFIAISQTMAQLATNLDNRASEIVSEQLSCEVVVPHTDGTTEIKKLSGPELLRYLVGTISKLSKNVGQARNDVQGAVDAAKKAAADAESASGSAGTAQQILEDVQRRNGEADEQHVDQLRAAQEEAEAAKREASDAGRKVDELKQYVEEKLQGIAVQIETLALVLVQADMLPQEIFEEAFKLKEGG